MTNRCSFLETEKWIQDILQYAEENVTIILVGNKFDLADKREVTFTEASALAEKFKLDYMEVSTKSSMNINLLFEVLCQQLIKANDESQIISEKKQKNGSLDKTVLYDRRKRRNIHSKEKCC